MLRLLSVDLAELTLEDFVRFKEFLNWNVGVLGEVRDEVFDGPRGQLGNLNGIGWVNEGCHCCGFWSRSVDETAVG